METIGLKRFASGLATFIIVSTLFLTDGASPASVLALSNFRWEPLTTGTALSGLKWNAVATSTDGSKLVAAEVDGGIWTSTDSGATWIRRTEGKALMDNRVWSNVSSSADGTKLLAVAYDGYDYGGNDVWTSADGGATWVNRNVDGATFEGDSFTVSASSSDGNNLVIGLEQGNIFRSTDSGATWTELMGDEGNNAPLKITSNTTGSKLAIGKPGEIYVSTDSGSTWDNVTVPAMVTNDGEIRGLKYVGTSTLYASQYEGDLWKSTNDGQSWTNLTEDDDDMSGIAWESLDSSADGLKVLVGTDNASIWMSDDGGASWTDAKVASPALTNSYWTVALAGTGSKAYALAWEGDIWTAPASDSGDEDDQGSDADGISDATEEAAPNGGDGNNDGIADSQQGNVASLVSSVNGKYVTLALDDECLLSGVAIAAESAKTIQDSAYNYPAGLVNFTANCESSTVKVYFYGSGKDLTVRKYNPNTNTYFKVASATIDDQTIGGQLAKVVSYTVADGGELDMDGQDNGVIVDPVGLAVLAANASPTPTSINELPDTGARVAVVWQVGWTMVVVGFGLRVMALGRRIKS